MTNFKSKFLGVFLLVLSTGLYAQLNPVKWTTTIKSIDIDKYQINIKAKIDPGYHIYTEDIDPNVGPIPLSVTYEKKLNINPDKIKASGHKITKFDDAFGAELSWYENEINLIQTIITKPNSSTAAGTIEYMVCNDNSCMPGSYDFSLKLPIASNIPIQKDSTKILIDSSTPVGVSKPELPTENIEKSEFNWDKIDKNCFKG